MKLITELRDDIDLNESLDESTGLKSLHIQGPFMQAEQKNRNGRVYPLETLIREVNRYTSEKIDKNMAYGELGHPAGPTVNLDRASHRIVELKQDGNDFIGKAKIIEGNPMGDIVINIHKNGGIVGVSSRGMGSLKESRNGHIVQEDFYLATPADIVADPSAPDAYVDGIMEGREWVWENGLMKEVVQHNHKQTILKASKHELEEAKLFVFSDFLQRL